MDNFKKSILIISLPFLAFNLNAKETFTSLEPPIGWSKSKEDGFQKFLYKASSGEVGKIPTEIKEGVVYSKGKIKIDNKVFELPVKFKYKNTVKNILVNGVLKNPALRFGAGVLGWLSLAGLIYDSVKKIWKKQTEVSDIPDRLKDKELGRDYFISNGFDYDLSTPRVAWIYHHYEVACRSLPRSYYKFLSASDGSCSVMKTTTKEGKTITEIVNVDLPKVKSKTCLAGSIVTIDNYCYPLSVKVEEQPITEMDFERIIAPIPIPDEVYKEYPEPLPVEAPEIEPKFIPIGDPVINPNYNPNIEPTPANQPYIQPGVEVKPAPIPNNPWRVVVIPNNKPVPSNDPSKNFPETKPEPIPNPDSSLNPSPDNNPAINPNPDSSSEPVPPFDLCKEHPEILGCIKLDDVPDIDLPEKTIPISITPDSGWGASDAVCPSPKILNIQGRELPISFDLYCGYARGIRPVILAVAWLMASFILIGFRRS